MAAAVTGHRPARPLPWDRPLLPPGTRVRRVTGGQRGTVQRYSVSVGVFPVRWDDPGTGAIWETCGADDVTVIERAPRTAVTPLSA